MGLSPAVLWLGLLIILLVIEALTLGLTTIWFAGGALAAFLAALIQIPLPVQIGLFFVVSLALLIFTRPMAIRFMDQKTERTNVDSLLEVPVCRSVLGQKALVTEKIENLKGTGRVKIKGVDWTARTREDGKSIASDTVVTVLEVQGVKLIVDDLTDKRSEG